MKTSLATLALFAGIAVSTSTWAADYCTGMKMTPTVTAWADPTAIDPSSGPAVHYLTTIATMTPADSRLGVDVPTLDMMAFYTDDNALKAKKVRGDSSDQLAVSIPDDGYDDAGVNDVTVMAKADLNGAGDADATWWKALTAKGVTVNDVLGLKLTF